MRGQKQQGFTLVETVVALFVLAVVSLSLFALFTALIHSMILARKQATALSLATTQLEYLKSLPYDSLAVQGGAIYASTLLPATQTKTINGQTYTITTAIGYADDAYDGCGPYPTTALKQKYCRNYPPPATAPATDLNPADYKILHVTVADKVGTRFTSMDTEVTARVAESASTTGAVYITVLDGSGNPITGASVAISNTTINPAVTVGDLTDENGIAIFYNLPPSAGNTYVVTASKTSWSSLSSIAASGALQATYQNIRVLSQQSAALAMPLVEMIPTSLVVETTDTAGAPLANTKVSIKGGYKKYTATTDTSYYYDNFSPTDTRPTTDAAGLTSVSNLPPYGEYLFCGDSGVGGCKVGATTYYLAAAVPYGGPNSLKPVAVRPFTDTDTALPYAYGTGQYRQKVRLMLTTNSTFPRVFSISPDSVAVASTSNLSTFLITITGENLGSATAKLTKDGSTYNGTSCTQSAKQLKCSYNLTGITTGKATLSVTNASGTLALPTDPLGGFNVLP